ncbi:MAG: hypothetical protein Kow0042_06030 [Calditrichia bacterium]
MKHHGKKLIGELCNYLGEDLDHPMCQELLQHVNECPECRQYIESIKLTVHLCRETFQTVPVPEHVKENLFKKLKIRKP